MESQQTIDALTAHIALYHSASHRDPNPNPNPRSAILRWFAALPTASHRQSALTALDPDFLRLLLRMLARLRRSGHGHFFLLPDLPDPSAPSLPGLCFRRSAGLLARAAAADPSARSFSSSLLLFSSREGSPSAPLDAVTVSEDLVADVGRFVEIMDGVSNGRFLRGDVSATDLGSSWTELPWLKDKGYYSLEAFVANRMEVALRLSWLNSNAGKKQKGGRSKEKAGAAGVAANAFWRKKGCLDWWSGLDPGRRKKIFAVFVGKAAKSLVNEIVKGPNISLKNEICFFDVEAEVPLRYGPTASWKRANQSFFEGPPDFCLDIVPAPSSGRPNILANSLNRLLVLQEISAIHLACQLSELEKERLFFSTLGSTHTISDCILRKLQGLLMVVSTDYINLELMGDAKLKILPNNNEVKFKKGCRKGKNKCHNSKKLNTIPNPSKVDSTLLEPSTDHGCRRNFVEDSSSRLHPQENTLCAVANQKTRAANTCSLQKDHENETSLVKHEMENTVSLVHCKGHTDRKKNGRKGVKGKTTGLKKVGNSELRNKKTALLSVAAESVPAKSVGLTSPLVVHPISNDMSVRGNLSPVSSFRNASNGPNIADSIELRKSSQVDHVLHSIADSCVSGVECFPNSDKSEDGDMFKHVSPCLTKDEEILKTSSAPIINACCDQLIGHCDDSPSRYSTNTSSYKELSPTSPTRELENAMIGNELGHHSSGCISDASTHPVALPKLFQAPMVENVDNQTNAMGVTSYEWPSIAPLNFTSVSSEHLPATTDRLHLDVGCKWPSQFHQPFLPSRPHARNSSVESTQSLLPSPALPMSFDWPLMVKSCSRLSQTVTVSYDSGCSPGMQSPFCSGFAAHGMQINGTASEKERKHYGDIIDVYDLKNASELADDAESYWWSEEESDTHAFSARDYNQFFGGGVMYWNPAEHVGTGFSRPPSHSSEDSSWAWREADLNRAIDDMVGLSGMPTSYNTNGLASPPAATFCSPFDPLGPGNQGVGYAIPGNDASGKVLHSSSSISDVPEEKVSRPMNNSPSGVEGVKGDHPPYPILRPIIVPSISRKGSRSEFKIAHDHKSPCVPSTRRDHPRIKRPPSPVVLCVPPVPRPPPPSPVGESRKRGFPIVRSGSSSPRHWGMRSWYHEESNSEETRLCLDGAEVIWPSWGNKGLAATPIMQSIQGSLLQDHLITISQLARDQGHPDAALPLQPPDILDCPSHKTSLSMMHSLLHEEIETFCKQVASENLMKKPYINWAVKRVTRSLQVLWPRSRTHIFGSNVTGLALPTSDVDLVVSLPPVRNLEPIKEAGILEGRNGIKETCLQHAARYLANQEWVRNDSLKTIENTAIPIIMLVVDVPRDIKFNNGTSPIVDTPQSHSTKAPGKQVSAPYSDLSTSENTPLPMYSEIRKDGAIDAKSIRLDISFKSPSHTGLQTSELVRELTQQFPASVRLALVLKKFLADRSLDHSYSGGLSSYCLMMLITRFLQHEHHISRPINQNLGSLLMDFLYFFGNIFDPRQMRISIQGSGVYMNRERGHSIDPIHIDDPLYPTNNVGRNCFRIHQCIKAFADAYSVLENELPQFAGDCGTTATASFRLLPKIIPSIDLEE